MAIIEKKNIEEWKDFMKTNPFSFNDSFERINSLIVAVEVMTEALEHYSRRSDDYFEARNILEKVWGEDEN